MSSSEEYGTPPKFGRIAQLRGFLPLNSEDSSPMTTHGNGTLSALIRSRSNSSLQTLHRRLSVFRGDDEETATPGRLGAPEAETDDFFRRNDERRLSLVLHGPQVRSQRLIGNSNPRYRWERYWKTEEQLKPMRKPMYARPDLLQHGFWSCTNTNLSGGVADVNTMSAQTR
jgi:hypothetical protein